MMVCGYCFHVAVRTINVTRACEIDKHVVSVSFSEIVRMNLSETSSRGDITRSSPCGDRDTMYTLYVVPLPRCMVLVFPCRLRVNPLWLFLKVNQVD